MTWSVVRNIWEVAPHLAELCQKTLPNPPVPQIQQSLRIYTILGGGDFVFILDKWA